VVVVGSEARKRWVWVALCKQTRQMVACVIGGRGVATCKQFWKGFPQRYKQGLLYSDF
jgi:insertion element IS1 protein InsB